ncbi:MAG: ABC transporter permease [Candidatus Eisenbacteria bacterium]
MRPAILIQIAGRSILKNKLRTLLTMLGIIIGVGAVLLMVAIGAGARGQIADRIGDLGTNLIVITPGSTAQGGVSQGAQSFNRLTLDDAEVLREQSFLLAAVSPVIVTRTQVVGGAGNWRTFIHGVDSGYETIRDWSPESGVFFGPADVRTMRKVAVLGRTVADVLFPGEDPIGRQIRIRNVPFQVVGVLAAKGQTAEGRDQDDVVLAPYTTVQNRLSGRMFIAQILASTSSPEEIPAAQEEIRAILRVAHGLGGNDSDDFDVRDQADLTEAAQETTRVMTLLLLAIASISLVVGGIGIMNIMLVSVTERTREIGLRLALGARGADVLTQFLVESVVMSLAGGVIGVALGYGGSVLLGRLTGWGVAISLPIVLLALGFAAAVGVFFGYYPARRAAALDPIEALRHE